MGDNLVGSELGGPTGVEARPARIRVLVADDHPIVREGLRALIGGKPDMELAGEVSRLRSHFVAGIKHMPVRFSPAA